MRSPSSLPRPVPWPSQALAAVLLALNVATLAGCASAALLRPPDSMLVTVELSGGECPQGECRMRYELRRNGSVAATGQAPWSLAPETVAQIAAAVDAADWDAIRARPFTGECPTAYDGQERTYTFDTLRGAVVVASCTVQIDPGQEPFRSVDDALFAIGG